MHVSCACVCRLVPARARERACPCRARASQVGGGAVPPVVDTQLPPCRLLRLPLLLLVMMLQLR